MIQTPSIRPHFSAIYTCQQFSFQDLTSVRRYVQAIAVSLILPAQSKCLSLIIVISFNIAITSHYKTEHLFLQRVSFLLWEINILSTKEQKWARARQTSSEKLFCFGFFACLFLSKYWPTCPEMFKTTSEILEIDYISWSFSILKNKCNV